ncbi:MAG TPA: alpha-2-macroglobulin family protein [Longimicrobiales bacterium]|nr:alpha-2-macroglobulin family protein [Longimicrobiales bacterium]
MAPDTVVIPPLPLPPAARSGGPSEPGLEVRLRSAPATAAPGHLPSARPQDVPLAPTRSAALLARLPTLPAASGEPFRFPAATPPPPRTGRVQLATFPAGDSVAPPATGPADRALRVVRVTPDGEAALAPHLTITFSNAMVPLSTVAAAEVGTPPVRLSPQPPGRWTWLDPRTLRFVPAAGRFPMAPAFAVEVAAGASSATGHMLEAPVQASFATPAPRATGAWPALRSERQVPEPGVFGRPEPADALARSVVRDPVVLIAFDQPVEVGTVLNTTRLLANGAVHAVRAARPDEVAADTLVSRLVDELLPGHWVTLRPVRPLPAAADVRVVVERGTAGTEGPRRTERPQEVRFFTHGTLQVASHGCSRDPCAPGSPWRIQLTNPVARGTTAAGLVSVEPELKNMNVRVLDNEIVITGDARPETRYTVTVAARLEDRFGQQLTGNRMLTVDVGPPVPALAISGGQLIVLDPDGPPRVVVHSWGLPEVQVQVYRVEPHHWPAWAEAMDGWRQDRGQPPAPPGERVLSRTVASAAGAGFAELQVDVGAAFEDGLGHAIIMAEPASPLPDTSPDRMSVRPMAAAWIQSTHLGLAAVTDGSDILAWASSLRGAAPVSGAEITALPGGESSVTTGNGTTRVPLGADGALAVVARLGADAALLPASGATTARTRWSYSPPRPQLRWYVLTDRGVYQPGETVHLKGWLRRFADARTVEPALPTGLQSVDFEVNGPRAESLFSAELPVTGLGGFSTTVDLPDAVNLGRASLRFRADTVGAELGNQHSRSFLIQEFRRPDYEVGLEADPGPHMVGGMIDVALQTSYFGGGGLGEADVDWRVRTQPGRYKPPEWTRWHFGRTPGWEYHIRPDPEEHVLRGRTDGEGRHRMLVELLSVDPPFPVAVRVEAQVQDVTRQVVSAALDLLVHPADVSVGLRATAAWLRPDEAAEIQVVVVDHDGGAVAGRPVHVTLARPTDARRADAVPPDNVPARTICRVVSAAEPVTCPVSADSAGAHVVTAEVRDGAGRTSRTEITLQVAGPGGPPDPRSRPGWFDMVADREEYEPGDTARLLVQAPFYPAEALVTVRGAGLLSTERLRLTEPGAELPVPITEFFLGGVGVRVDLQDAAGGVAFASSEVRLNVPPRRRGLDVVVIPADSLAAPGGRTSVRVEVKDAGGRPVPNAEVAVWMVDEAVLALGDYELRDPLSVFYAPRFHWVREQQSRRWVVQWPRSAGPGTLSGLLLDDAGRVLAGVPVRVVEAGAAGVTNFDGSFTLRGLPPGEYVLEAGSDEQARRLTVVVPAAGAHAGNLVLAATGLLRATTISTAGGGADVEIPPPPAAAPPPPSPPSGQLMMRAASTLARGDADVELRSDFSALAVFEPALRTDATGTVQVDVRMPASLTRYRVMAVAAAGSDLYGTAEAAVTARKELMVRIMAPRFLHRGDRFELPVLLQNGSDSALTVEVAARGSGLDLHGPDGRQVTLPAGGRAEVRFDASTLRPGTAFVQVVAVAGELNDAAAAAVPVLTPGVPETFALHGTMDDAAPVVLPLARPQGVIEDFGGVEVSISSTALQSLTDAVLFLHTYPFPGTEHLSSRVLAVATLRDFLDAFAADGLPPPDSLVLAVERDISDLVARQGRDGGWPFWRGGGPSHPFVSLHTAHALERARANGFDVPAATLAAARDYLGSIEEHTAQWPPAARRSAEAYAVYVRHRLGDAEAAADARRLAVTAVAHAVGGFPVEATGWLLYVLADDPQAREPLRRALLNRLVETAGTVSFAEHYEDDGTHVLLHSRRRSDAVALEALTAVGADTDIVARLAGSLLAHRTAGRWSGTQENSWVLVALERYFRTFEATTPSFTAGVWLGDRYAGGGEFRGRTTDVTHVVVPMAELLRADASEASMSDLVVGRTGEGRMYFRAALRYAPADPRTPSAERGFSVTRRYEAVDDPADVSRDADGTWRLRAGARVRVTVTMVAPSARYHVALVDPLPGGVEPLNPALAGTGFTDAASANRAGSRPPPPPRGALPPAPAAPPPPRLWQATWFEHQNLRDDRAEAFSSLLPAGVWEYSYLVRATTPGTFVVPPARAEMMYEPETFGRGEGDVVVVTDGAGPGR